MSEQFKCHHCDRAFTTENGRWQHTRDKHPGTKRRGGKANPKPEREESIGEMAARAAWDDDPALDWVRDMMDIEAPGYAD